MSAKRYRVTLENEERAQLEELVSHGKGAARRMGHARVLLHADSGPAGPGWSDTAIAAAVGVSVPTIERIRRRFVEDGLDAALSRRPSRRVYPRKLDGVAEAHLIALACGSPPDGRARWTLQLLAERMMVLGYVDSPSYETVRTTLKQTPSNRI